MNKTCLFARRLPVLLLVFAAFSGPLQADEALPKFQREKTVVQIESGPWKGPRLKDGQPDVQGTWSNTIGNHTNLTDPQGGIPGEKRQTPLGPRSERAPSRISDPADGEIPFQPWARAKQQEFLANFHNPTKPEYIEPLARCAPGGPSKSFMWHGFDIRQYPGYVVFLFDSGSRVIHLDKTPHLHERVKLWNGDSRGHWEGNTLVVEVRNVNGKARFGRTGEFFSENARIAERYVFDSQRQRFLYHATYDDPTVFTRPFTVSIPLRRVEQFAHDNWNNILFPAKHAGKAQILERYEQICVENNGGHGNGGVR